MTAGKLAHEAVLYATDEQLLASVVPCLQIAAQSGDPVVLAFDAVRSRQLRDAAPDVFAAVDALDLDDYEHRPATVIRRHRDLFARAVADGATRVWVLGEVPHPGIGVPWHEWARYEATINYAYAPFPVRGLCQYDLRTTPTEVLADVWRTYPVVHDGGRGRNSRFENPEDFLIRHEPPAREWALPAFAAAFDLHDPIPAAAREAVRASTPGTGLAPDVVDDMVLAISEAVTSALVHGTAPVRLRIWPQAGRIVAAVDDRGPGPADPYAGMFPTADTYTGGLGLWLIHQMCAQVSFGQADGGFRIRIVAGRPERIGAGHG